MPDPAATAGNAAASPSPYPERTHAGHTATGGPTFPVPESLPIPAPSTHQHGSGAAATGEGHPSHVGLQTTATDPKHVGAGGAGHGEDFLETVLMVRAYRQQLIASNIANADTPNYKAVDIDFQEALRIAPGAAASAPVALALTSARHLPGTAAASVPPLPLKHPIPSQAGADGNTVDMDAETAKFAENAVMYEFTLGRVSDHNKHMMEMLALT